LAILRWAFILLGVGLIIVLIVTAPKEKRLTCHQTAASSLTSFGECTGD
jgi:hypothetical protein